MNDAGFVTIGTRFECLYLAVKFRECPISISASYRYRHLLFLLSPLQRAVQVRAKEDKSLFGCNISCLFTITDGGSGREQFRSRFLQSRFTSNGLLLGTAKSEFLING